MADSNVLMPRDYVRRLLSAWGPGTGLVCSPPIGCAPKGAWAELECAFLNTYQARWQCFADSIGMGFAQGKTMLWRREVLERGGGIRVLAGEAAEDAAATKLVSKQGLRVRIVNRPFEQPLGYRTALEVWRRQLRWARLRRDTFKLFFLIEIFAGAIPPLLACAAVTATMDWPVVSILAALAIAWYLAEAIWPMPPAGIFPCNRSRCACCAICCSPRSGSRPGSATNSCGAATPCASPIPAQPDDRHRTAIKIRDKPP